MERTKRPNGELKIRVSGLSNGLHEYHLSTDPGAVGLDDSFREPVDVEARIDKNPRQIYLTAEIHTTGHFECDRCLDEFDRPLTAAYSMLYVYRELDGGKQSPEEVTVIDPETAQISLAEDVRQMVMLAVPLKLLCREECKGLCPRCGANLNHGQCRCEAEVRDSPLSGLRDLLH